MKIRKFFSWIMGGVPDGPPVPHRPDQAKAEAHLNDMVQRAVVTQALARMAVREGNGRVIALLQGAVGGHR